MKSVFTTTGTNTCTFLAQLGGYREAMVHVPLNVSVGDIWIGQPGYTLRRVLLWSISHPCVRKVPFACFKPKPPSLLRHSHWLSFRCGEMRSFNTTILSPMSFYLAMNVGIKVLVDV